MSILLWRKKETKKARGEKKENIHFYKVIILISLLLNKE